MQVSMVSFISIPLLLINIAQVRGILSLNQKNSGILFAFIPAIEVVENSRFSS
jgi:hypothetical protein